ncbi:hypothetical protein V1508DRAFT_44262 [Lipomyces doorenjongii]|uniref:uncharacterized protein n=1 Tax=Lipomyces doorenjongii TaxID=383834 RepID=UPI0034CE5D99
MFTTQAVPANDAFQFQRCPIRTWIVTQLVDQHENHELRGINPLAYPENRPLGAGARETMLDLVRHSNASYTSIAFVVNNTYGLSLLGRDVYNRSYDHTQTQGASIAKFIESLLSEGYIYRTKLTMDNTFERQACTVRWLSLTLHTRQTSLKCPW